MPLLAQVVQAAVLRLALVLVNTCGVVLLIRNPRCKSPLHLPLALPAAQLHPLLDLWLAMHWLSHMRTLCMIHSVARANCPICKMLLIMDLRKIA